MKTLWIVSLFILIFSAVANAGTSFQVLCADGDRVAEKKAQVPFDTDRLTRDTQMDEVVNGLNLKIKEFEKIYGQLKVSAPSIYSQALSLSFDKHIVCVTVEYTNK